MRLSATCWSESHELEWRVNGGFTSAAKLDERPVITGAANSRVINSLTSTSTVVSTSTYDVTERQATEALDQALIVRGGLLLPSGTLEIDNTTSYFSASSDHLSRQRICAAAGAGCGRHCVATGARGLPLAVLHGSAWDCRISFRWTSSFRMATN